MPKSAYQPMPCEGVLAQNLNLSLEALLDRIDPFLGDVVYPYVLTSLRYDDVRLHQQGSGPNFQGGLITLCTCKHLMRTYPVIKSGKDVWIAGYSSSTHSGGSMLFYLMKIALRFESYQDFWFSDFVPEGAKVEKVADSNIFGDIYRPKSATGNPHWHRTYHAPPKGHAHCRPGARATEWWTDIEYRSRSGCTPALLVGDPEFSFLWDEPVIPSPFGPKRALPKGTLTELFPFASRPCPSPMTVEAGN